MIHFCKAEQTHGYHGPARYAYAINPLLDRDTDCVLDVEATPARFAARVAATQALVSRASIRPGIEPASLAAATAYGSGPLLGWHSERNLRLRRLKLPDLSGLIIAVIPSER